EVRGRRKDGTVFPLYLGVSETLLEGGVVFTGILRDISERERSAELQLAKDAADQANAAKSEFLSRMSHELRTPLNSVLGFAQLLAMRHDEEDIRQATDSILKAGKHLLNLINEVLDLSGIEAGRVTLSLEPVALMQTLEHAVELMRPLAESARIALRLDASDFEGAVLADRQRLVQVFINLISNAIKYNSADGQVVIALARQSSDTVTVRFVDTGPGISEADVPKLFQPFERFGPAAVEGTGLGLVLSRRFVELMGGTLELAASSPSGSVFEVMLRRSVGVGQAKADRPHKSRRRRLGEGRVIYVEDNLANLRLIEMALDDWPHIELVPATQGLIGYELAKSIVPHVILLDLHLPDMHGSEVLAKLKHDPATAHIPVVVVSADATRSQIGALRRAGAYDYLTKPLDISRLLDVLEELLPDSAD
ncbi:MAG TPA: ATP-binding protein, partial [Fimbriimonadaceae bacterium]|nr:ATP-binding protein [Fimbriimonadaceae bacterium]